MGKFTDDPSQFKTEALKMIQEVVTQKGLTVWQGEFKGFFSPYDQPFDCLVVGIGESGQSPNTSQCFLAVRFDTDGTMRYETRKQSEKGETGGGTIPIGGIHHPLEVLEGLVKKLPNILPPA